MKTLSQSLNASLAITLYWRDNMQTKFTVYFNQMNRTNFQVLAESEEEAIWKAVRLYKKNLELPSYSVEKHWIQESDGEDT